MPLFNDVNYKIKNNKKRRLEGDVMAIPWSLPRLSKVLPGIEQGRYNLISASPKAGKSMLTDFLYVYQPVEWIIKNPDTDISLKIFYFSLEVSKESKIKAAMCYKLFRDHDILISPQKISSIFQDYILDDKIEKIIGSLAFREWFHKFEEMIAYYDSIRNPYGIFNTVRSYAENPKVGTYTYKNISWQNNDGTYSQKRIRDKYIPKNPKEYVIVVVDHVSLLQPERGQTLHEAISKFSSDYCLQMRDKWNYIPVMVQQQAADSSKAQFNYRGETVIDKIKPDPEGLADMKYTARDADLMLSLFYPYRYKIEEYEDINLVAIGDQHREMMINLNRNGISNASIQMLFLGSSSYLTELPKKLKQTDYRAIKELVRKQI